MRKGRIKLALEDLNEAIRLEPDNVVALTNLQRLIPAKSFS